MGKKRNTAKTGDSAIYKGRNNVIKDPVKDDDNDPMFNRIDRFHNAKEEEFLKLDAGDNESESDDGEKEEGVMDLGIGGESSDESDSDGEDNDDVVKNARHVDPDSGEEELSSSDDDDEEEEMEDVRDWGKKKASYYNGDTADLEIGQDEEDAYLEEEAAKEVQAARYKEMDEDDFVLSDNEEDVKEAGDEVGELSSARDVMKLSLKDKRKVLDKQHPEFMPLLSHFSSVVKDLDSRTAVAAGALFDGDDENAEVRQICCVSLCLYAPMIDQCTGNFL
jgi:U3 small nucleolar RNA-associated protein 3